MQVKAQLTDTATYQKAIGDGEKHLHDYSVVMRKEKGNHHINIPSICQMNCQLNVKNSGHKKVSHLVIQVETALIKAKWRYKRIDTWRVRSLERCGKF